VLTACGLLSLDAMRATGEESADAARRQSVATLLEDGYTEAAMRLASRSGIPVMTREVRVLSRLVRIEECSSLDGYWMIGRAVTVQVRRRRMREGTMLCVSVRFVIPYVEGDDGPPELLAATTLRLPVARAGDHIDVEVG
jgi:hypothetical protein